MVVALVIGLLIRFRKGSEDAMQSIPVLVLGVLVLTLVQRSWVTLYYPWSLKGNVFVTHLRMDSLTFGVLLSWLYWFRRAELSHHQR